MEKLIELLNECKPTVSCANFKEHYEFIDDDIYLIREWMDGEEEQFPMYVCYKKGDFIKWLVDNDKIDRLTFCTIETPSSKYEDFDLWPETPREDYTNILLMDLAIQEKPIEFLISILK